jgi:hypothetical protein
MGLFGHREHASSFDSEIQLDYYLVASTHTARFRLFPPVSSLSSKRRRTLYKPMGGFEVFCIRLLIQCRVLI